MNIVQRKLLMTGLVAAFALQTVLVYGDDTHRRFEPFGAQALAGRRLWHAHNCHVCHQIYGFGGFLGPDLTNVAARADRERFDKILTEGSMQMPAFRFGEEEIDALVAFFEALDKTGVGQCRLAPPPAPGVIDAAVVRAKADAPMSDAAARGHELFRTRGCVACHRPLYSFCLGVHTAPDLSLATSRWTDAQIDTVLREGRGVLMQPTNLAEGERADVLAWLHWMHDHRAVIQGHLEVPKGRDAIPWFEFGHDQESAR